MSGGYGVKLYEGSMELFSACGSSTFSYWLLRRILSLIPLKATTEYEFNWNFGNGDWPLGLSENIVKRIFALMFVLVTM
ncbi:hypothetical protein QN277_018330 [Acacia crassicarpa]|uniref:Uncharacterized protein n=1 Tax=Acacia crassicarpa TaxID=499986 RepID=A0AAE1JQX3_9FABA|nr:hypothetical protein QN277_018330 [Acacia crassicarpa]